MTRPGAQGRRDAVRDARHAVWWLAHESVSLVGDPRAYRAMRRKLVAAMRRAVNEVVSSERKAGR